MGKTRPRYSAEFREQMVKLVRSGRTSAALVNEFAIVNRVGATGGRALRGRRRRKCSPGANAGSWQGCAGERRWSATSWQRVKPGLSPKAARGAHRRRTYEREPGRIPRSNDMPGAGRVPQRFLRLGALSAKPACDERHCAYRADQAGVYKLPRDRQPVTRACRFGCEARARCRKADRSLMRWICL